MLCSGNAAVLVFRCTPICLAASVADADNLYKRYACRPAFRCRGQLVLASSRDAGQSPGDVDERFAIHAEIELDTWDCRASRRTHVSSASFSAQLCRQVDDHGFGLVIARRVGAPGKGGGAWRSYPVSSPAAARILATIS